MNRILTKKNLSGELIRLEIGTPLWRQGIGAGQYIVVKTSWECPAVALPVVKSDPDRGSVWVIVNPLDRAQGPLGALAVGSVLQAVEGPYGLPLQLPASASVLCVGDDPGAAALLAVVTALGKAGNRVVALLRGDTPGQELLRQEIGAQVQELLLPGIPGQPATLEQALLRALREHAVQEVVVAGSARTIRDTFAVSIHHPLSTQALMVDSPAGKSVHGIFRVSSSRQVRSVCVDGHDFNAYYASLDEMVRRFERPGAGVLQG